MPLPDTHTPPRQACTEATKLIHEFKYPTFLHLTPFPQPSLVDTLVCGTDVMSVSHTALQRSLPPALWVQLLTEFADVAVAGDVVSHQADQPSLSTALKKGTSATPLIVPFAVRWLSRVLQSVGALASPSPTRTNEVPPARSVVQTLSNVVVSLYTVVTALKSAYDCCVACSASRQAEADRYAAFLLLALSFVYQFEKALCDAHCARATQQAERRRLSEKCAAFKEATDAEPRDSTRHSATHKLRQLLRVHADRIAHPAGFFMCTLGTQPHPGNTDGAARRTDTKRRPVGTTSPAGGRAVPLGGCRGVLAGRPQARRRRARSRSSSTSCSSSGESSSDSSVPSAAVSEEAGSETDTSPHATVTSTRGKKGTVLKKGSNRGGEPTLAELAAQQYVGKTTSARASSKPTTTKASSGPSQRKRARADAR